jgi:uncharacterized protein (TIGR02145 family)
MEYIMIREKISLLTAIFIATIFTFSCTSSDVDDLPSPQSSSSQQSGSVLCVLGSGCVTLDIESCLQHGTPVDSCPAESSSSSSSIGVAPSSSSVARCGSVAYNPATQFCDSRGNGKVYKMVKIGTQTWMAENLNYEVSDSKCYNNDETSCATYDRLYKGGNAVVDNICPSGWHLPSDIEWGTLMLYINPSCSITGNCTGAGKLLKATSGWSNNGNGTDAYGFAALPNGEFNHDRAGFLNIGTSSVWWSSTRPDNVDRYYRSINYNSDNAPRGTRYWQFFFAVRCLKD